MEGPKLDGAKLDPILDMSPTSTKDASDAVPLRSWSEPQNPVAWKRGPRLKVARTDFLDSEMAY